MKHLALCTTLLILASGCSSILSRQAAYSVLPVSSEELAGYQEFSVITPTLPPLFQLSEEGLAWEISVRFSDGTQRLYLATMMMFYDETNQKVALIQDDAKITKLYSILPFSKEALTGAKAVLLSHDHSFCAKLDGQVIGPCPSLDDDDFDWSGLASDLSAFAENASGQNLSKQELLAIFAKAKEQKVISEANFGLAEKQLQALSASDSASIIIPATLITLQSGLQFLVVSLLASPLAGSLTAGVTAVLGGTQHLLRFCLQPDINQPEYLSGFVRNLTFGKFKLQFYQGFGFLKQQITELTIGQAELAERITQLEQLCADLTARLQALGTPIGN